MKARRSRTKNIYWIPAQGRNDELLVRPDETGLKIKTEVLNPA